jgi:hypothetical protein
MFISYPAPMVTTFILAGISFLFLWCRCRNQFLTTTPAAVSIISFITLFYITLSNLHIEKVPDYLNPFSFIILCASIPLGIFVGVFCHKQLSLVSRGLTTKQYESIHKEVIFQNEKFDPKFNLNRPLGFFTRLKNIFKFFCNKNSESLIRSTDV